MITHDRNNQISSTPWVRVLVSASTDGRSESEEPGLDPKGERTVCLVADMVLVLADETGLAPTNPEVN